MPKGLPKPLTEDAGHRADRRGGRRRPDRPARPGHPRGALRHRPAHLRAGRPVAGRPRPRRLDCCGRFGKGSKERDRAHRPPGPRGARRRTCRPAARRPSWCPSGGRAGATPRRSSSTGGAAGCRARGPGRSCGATASAAAWATTSARTCCATRAPPTCSTTAPTSGWCRSCSATPRSAPRRCTRWCRPSGSGRCTGRPTPGRPVRRGPAGGIGRRRLSTLQA